MSEVRKAGNRSNYDLQFSLISFWIWFYLACNCDTQGTIEAICSNQTGTCMCKEGFGGDRCDQCLPGFYDFPNCFPCECSDVGSVSEICDVKTGECNCKSNYGDRQCDKCQSGFYSYPDCFSKYSYLSIIWSIYQE